MKYLQFSLDSYDQGVKFLYTQRDIVPIIYNENLNRFIFNQHDNLLELENVADTEENGASIENTDVYESLAQPPKEEIGNGSVIEISAESELDLNENYESTHSSNVGNISLVRSSREEFFECSDPSLFDESGLINIIENEKNVVYTSVENDEAGRQDENSETSRTHDEIYLERTNDENASITEPQEIKKEKTVKYLNLPDEVLDVSDEEFEALRQEIAYSYDDNDDSFEELKKEFDGLLAEGYKIPMPIKEEPVDIGHESNHLVPNISTNFIRLEYPNSIVEYDMDPVLGTMPRMVNVSIDYSFSLIDSLLIKKHNF